MFDHVSYNRRAARRARFTGPIDFVHAGKIEIIEMSVISRITISWTCSLGNKKLVARYMSTCLFPPRFRSLSSEFCRLPSCEQGSQTLVCPAHAANSGVHIPSIVGHHR